MPLSHSRGDGLAPFLQARRGHNLRIRGHEDPAVVIWSTNSFGTDLRGETSLGGRNFVRLRKLLQIGHTSLARRNLSWGKELGKNWLRGLGQKTRRRALAGILLRY